MKESKRHGSCVIGVELKRRTEKDDVIIILLRECDLNILQLMNFNNTSQRQYITTAHMTNERCHVYTQLVCSSWTMSHLSVFHDGHAVAALDILCWILTSSKEHSSYDVRSMSIKASNGSYSDMRSEGERGERGGSET